MSENAELEELIRKATGEGAPQPPAAGPPPAAADDEGDGTSSLDLGTLVLVARRSLLWVLLLIGLGFTASWLFLRYTKPVYRAASLLKIDERTEAGDLGLGAIKNASADNARSMTQLAGEVELIKSGLTYRKLKENLALDVNYYTQGTVLESELYGASPFRVEYEVTSPEFYNQKFNLSFADNGQFALSVKLPNQTLGGTYGLNQWVNLPGVKLKLLPPLGRTTLAVGDAKYHFVILDDGAVNAYLDRNLAVDVINPSANTIQISFTDNNPQKAQHIVNSIDSVYLQEKLSRKQEATAQQLKFLDGQLTENQQKLQVAEDNLRSFVQQSKTYDARSEVGNITQKLEKQQDERLKLEQKVRLLGEVERLANSEQLTSDETTTVEQSLPGLAGLEDPALAQLLNELNSLQWNLRRLLRSYKETTEAVKQQQAAAAYARTSLRRQLRQDQRLVQDQLALLNRQREALNAALQTLPQTETELARLQRPVELYGKTYLMLMDKKVEFNIAKAGTTPDFQILSPASAPTEPIYPRRLLVYAIGLAGGLALGLGLIGTRYLLHNTVTSVAELERNTRAAVLGVVPTYDKEKLAVSKLVVDKNPKSSVSEAIRSIRTNLDFIAPASKKRLISITSTISGEGKTFVTVNLGGIIALSGQRVIILDLDMRKPKVNLAFSAPNVKGISTILIDRHSVAECIQHSGIESLDFISAGPTPPNPSELILSPRFDQMLQELYQHYDLILIDTPPVGLVTDGILIMRKADVPIYIVRADYSRKSFLKNLNRLMRTNQFTRLCTILNDARSHGPYGYDYGYGYGYGYGSYGMGYYEEDARKPTLTQKIRGFFS